MLTESEVKFARYSTVEKEADKFGRVIGVRRLKPSEQTKLSGLTADVSGSDEAINENGEKVTIPHRMPLLIAAAVCMIDDVRIPFPRTRGELDAIYDRLDAEGVAAAGAALVRLSQADSVEDALVEAKN
jgi:hypothetical protein